MILCCQCDQMDRLFIQFLVIDNYEYLPKSRKNAKVIIKFCPMLNKPSNERQRL